MICTQAQDRTTTIHSDQGNVLCVRPDLLRDLTGLRELLELRTKGLQNDCTPSRRTKDHFKSTASGDCEGAGRVVECVTVRIWTDLFRLGRV